MEPKVVEKSSPYAFYAFYSLYNHLQHENVRYSVGLFDKICHNLFPTYQIDGQARKPLFITWKRKSKHSHEYHLRGCIGTFAKLPIATGIEKYALLAATEDSRFPPITTKELPLLKCSCNILENFEVIFDKKNKGDIFNWEIGKHGIELKFKQPGSKETFSSTFLPDVMVEQKWDKEDTFINLIEKAGVWNLTLEIMDNYEDYFIEVIRYEGNKSMIEYGTFKEELEKLESN